MYRVTDGFGDPNVPHDGRERADAFAERRQPARIWASCLLYGLIFATVYAWFFLIRSRAVNVYDEGIELTAAMRIAAGQVIHRDFYYNYGPAKVYMLAGLFKLFGQSVLIARLLWISDIAFGGVGVYILARRLAGSKWAAAALAVSVLWNESLGLKTLFTVWSTWLLLPLFERQLTRRRSFAAGLLVGLAMTFRYDTGVGLACIHVVIMAVAVFLTEPDARQRLRAGTSALWPYLVGFATSVVPLFVIYMAVGALHDFLYDIVLYPRKYYYAARNLPFPRVHRQNFEASVVYILPLLIAAGFYGALRWWMTQRDGERRQRCVPQWVGAMIAFAAVGGVMYLKALVRIEVGQLYMALAPCILLAMVLCVHRSVFGSAERAVLGFVMLLFVAGGVLPTVHDLENEHRQHASMLGWLIDRSAQDPKPPFDEWCRESNVVSKGFCFFPDTDHMQAIDYISAHTKPGDTLYVGLPQHERININDNLTYFATQRLPATKWSHFDPFLENREDVQREMIGELERNRPSYVVLDSEFENYREPNGSSVSTGVHLLDDYIAERYVLQKQFGIMTILKRR